MDEKESAGAGTYGIFRSMATWKPSWSSYLQKFEALVYGNLQKHLLPGVCRSLQEHDCRCLEENGYLVFRVIIIQYTLLQGLRT